MGQDAAPIVSFFNHNMQTWKGMGATEYFLAAQKRLKIFRAAQEGLKIFRLAVVVVNADVCE